MEGPETEDDATYVVKQVTPFPDGNPLIVERELLDGEVVGQIRQGPKLESIVEVVFNEEAQCRDLVGGAPVPPQNGRVQTADSTQMWGSRDSDGLLNGLQTAS